MNKNHEHQNSNPPVIKATSDIFIATLLSAPKNKLILLDLINAVLEDAGQVPAQTARVLNPFNVRAFAPDKQIVLDVRVKDETGRNFNIEIQTTLHAAFAERVLFGGADSIAAQLHAGENYTGLMPVICIVITEFKFMDQVDGAHLIFALREQNHPEVILTHHLQIHVLRLHRLLKGRPEALDNVSPKLRNWLNFLAFGGLKEEDEMSELVEKDPFVMKAAKALRRFSSNPAMQELERSHRLWKLEYYSGLEAAKKEGEEKGLIKGEAKGKAEGKAEGRIESILAILEARFGSVPNPVKTAVTACTDLAQLDALIPLAVTCDSMDAFKQGLPQP